MLLVFTSLAFVNAEFQCAAEKNYGCPECTMGTNCECPNGIVKYGYGNKWTEWVAVDANVQCTNGVFGDPFSGQHKICMCVLPADECGEGYTLSHVGYWDNAAKNSQVTKIPSSNNLECSAHCNTADSCMAYNIADSGNCYLYTMVGNEHLSSNSIACLKLSGCMNPEAINYNSGATIDDGSCIHECGEDYILSHIGYWNNAGDSSEVTKIPSSNNLDCSTHCSIRDSCVAYNIAISGNCYLYTVMGNEYSSPNSLACLKPIYGCMDSEAINYNSEATKDDGSCVYEFQCAAEKSYGCPECNMGTNCKCPNGMVKYGYGNKWTEWVAVDTSIQCSNGVFGDPFYGQHKICMCLGALPAEDRRALQSEPTGRFQRLLNQLRL